VIKKKQKKSRRTRTRTIVKIVHDKPQVPDPLGGMGPVIGAGVGLMSLGVIGSMGVGITSQIGSMLHAHERRLENYPIARSGKYPDLTYKNEGNSSPERCFHADKLPFINYGNGFVLKHAKPSSWVEINPKQMRWLCSYCMMHGDY